MPCATICWKSRMPWASMRLRSASCFLFLQTEAHGKRFLFCLLLGFDGRFECHGQLNIAQQDAFDDKSSF